MHDFDKNINRLGTNSMKWDGLRAKFGQDKLIPLWVADMDFEVSPAISKALKERADHHIYGYMHLSDEYYKSVIGWMQRRHNWEIDKDWIVFTPGVVPAISYAIRAFTEVGDNIIIQTPVYHHFKNTIEINNRNVMNNPLIYKNGTYSMDLEDLERKIDAKTKMIILCSPHNPVGRVWTKEELSNLAEICLRNNIIIVSDEIHFDLIYKENNHTVMANISPEIRDRCIVCTSPGKPFNIAGLQVANIIISNDELRKKYSRQLEKDHIVRPNIFGQGALIAAYDESEKWLDALIEYLEGNKNFFIDFIANRIPQLKVVAPEGTYLLWIDCSGLQMSTEQLNDFFLNKCKLALNDGESFGHGGKLFQRFNIACPKNVLEEALIKIEQSIKELCIDHNDIN